MEQREQSQSLINQLRRVGALGGLHVLHAFYADFSFSPHTHDEYMIAVTEDGFALPQFRGGGHLHCPGDILALNPGEVHGGGPAQGATWRYRSFYVPAELMQRAAQELCGAAGGALQFAADVIHDPALAACLLQAHRALELPSPALERETLLLEAFSGLVMRHTVEHPAAHSIGRENRAVERARACLEACPGENITLDRLAQEAGLSSFHLCRVFRKQTGLTPHAYQTLARLRLARTLLAQGVPIAQAAQDAGFYDQAHLTHHFKRVYGVTPGQYRLEV